MPSDEIHYQILRELAVEPTLTQRQLARSLGVSLGKINYCLRALVEKGLLNIESFRKSGNRKAYAYLLTPRGIANKTRMTRRFLQHKQQAYEALREEIDLLRRETEGG